MEGIEYPDQQTSMSQQNDQKRINQFPTQAPFIRKQKKKNPKKKLRARMAPISNLAKIALNTAKKAPLPPSDSLMEVDHKPYTNLKSQRQNLLSLLLQKAPKTQKIDVTKLNEMNLDSGTNAFQDFGSSNNVDQLNDFLLTVLGSTNLSNSKCMKEDLQNLVVASLRDQLDYYFGDSNLLKDKFLQKKLQKETQVNLALLLDFNRVKWLLDSYAKVVMSQNGKFDTEIINSTNAGSQSKEIDGWRIMLLQKAVRKSQVLKLSKCLGKLKRRIPFKRQEQDNELINKATIYVENIQVDHETSKQKLYSLVADVFSQIGPIQDITLSMCKPQEKDKYNQINQQSNYYCFIQYATEQDAFKARNLFDDKKWQTFMSEALTAQKSTIEQGQKVQQQRSAFDAMDSQMQDEQTSKNLRVITKAQWLSSKQNAKQIKDQISDVQMTETTASLQEFEQGTLIKILDLPSEVKKVDLTQIVQQFVSVAPAYLDMDQQVMRFKSKADADEFVKRQKLNQQIDKKFPDLKAKCQLVRLNEAATLTYYKQAVEQKQKKTISKKRQATRSTSDLDAQKKDLEQKNGKHVAAKKRDQKQSRKQK